jgi:hypothetical protein
MKKHHKPHHRFTNDLEKMWRADLHMKGALDYLRKCENSDRVLPLIAGVRRLRKELEDIFENALPRRPGEEAGSGLRRAV